VIHILGAIIIGVLLAAALVVLGRDALAEWREADHDRTILRFQAKLLDEQRATIAQLLEERREYVRENEELRRRLVPGASCARAGCVGGDGQALGDGPGRNAGMGIAGD